MKGKYGHIYRAFGGVGKFYHDPIKILQLPSPPPPTIPPPPAPISPPPTIPPPPASISLHPQSSPSTPYHRPPLALITPPPPTIHVNFSHWLSYFNLIEYRQSKQDDIYQSQQRKVSNIVPKSHRLVLIHGRSGYKT